MAKVSGLTAVERPDTLARSAYLRLQEAIRDGVVRHGPLYSENELAETLGMSRTPVREAVIALTREGLLEVSAQRGFRVRALSLDEQAEVFDLRAILETYVVRRLAEHTPEDAVHDLGPSSIASSASRARARAHSSSASTRSSTCSCPP